MVALSLLLPPLAKAANCQLVDGSTPGTKEALISASEITRIAIDGARVASTTYKESSGYSVQPDKGTGQLFVSPPATDAKPFRIFVISTSGVTHSLQLNPTKEAVSCVLIQEPAKATAQPQQKALPGVEALGMALPTSSAPDVAPDDRRLYQRLIVAVARGERPSDHEQQAINRPVDVWEQVKAVLVQRFHGRTTFVDHLRLTNISGAPMRIAEQELFQPNVAAVAIEIHELAPGATTDVFIVFVKEPQ